MAYGPRLTWSSGSSMGSPASVPSGGTIRRHCARAPAAGQAPRRSTPPSAAATSSASPSSWR
eukprot:2718362-Lingulodinium_polyedra.AAC.1